MIELLQQPWPWYVAGPLIGLVVPLLLLIGSKQFGVSSNLRHTCAACMPGRVEFFQYDWKQNGLWNLTFIGGTVIGGFLAGWYLNNPEPIDLSRQTVSQLEAVGVSDFSGIIVMVLGGFFVGFGARYAGGCTSGHAISGLANLQIASLLAVIGFFIGGLIITHFVDPFLL